MTLSIVAVITNQTVLGHKETQNKLQSYKMSLWNLWWPGENIDNDMR